MERIESGGPIENEETVSRLDALAEEFLEAVRAGRPASIEDYARRYPELAHEIRSLFPTMLAMEGLKIEKERSSSGGRVQGNLGVEKLGDFRIIGEIGRGGMGIVYEAEQQSLDRHVALKVLPRHALLDSKRLQRFQREAQTAARLHHSNIVPVFGVGEQDGLHYYVMQLIRGVGLDCILAVLKRNAGVGSTSGSNVSDEATVPAASRVASAMMSGAFPLTPTKPGGEDTEPLFLDFETATCTGSAGGNPKGDDELAHRLIGEMRSDYWISIAAMGRQVAGALAYAHGQGVLHRDIKPSNLLIDSRGTVWIADFGIAKALEKDGLTQTGDILGTLQYMPPEQMQGRQDARSDVYSLGLTLYEMCTLRRAWSASTAEELIEKITRSEPPRPRRIDPSIPKDLETIVLKSIARDPDHRYASADELADDLRRFIEGRPIQARPVGSVEQLWRWCRRNTLAASFAAAALVLLLATAVIGVWGSISTRRAYQREAIRRKESQAASRRAEHNLELALQAFENIFEGMAGRDLEDLDPDSAEAEDGSFGMTTSISERDAQLLEELLGFYDRFAAANEADDRLASESAWALQQMGRIHARLRQFDKAEEVVDKALRIHRATQKISPSDENLIAIADLLKDRALVDLDRGKTTDGMRRLQEAVTILSDETESPTSDAVRREFVRIHNDAVEHLIGRNRGFRPGRSGKRPTLNTKALQEWIPKLERSLEVAKELQATHAEDPGDLLRAGRSYLMLAAAYYGVNEKAKAASVTKPGLDLLQHLAESHPQVTEYTWEFLRQTLRATLLARSDRDLIPYLKRAMTLADQVDEHHPGKSILRSGALMLRERLGRMLAKDPQRADEAIEILTRARKQRQAMGGRDGRRRRPFASSSDVDLARALHASGQDAKALQLLEQVTRSPRSGGRGEMRSRMRGRVVKDALLLMAEIHEAAGRSDKAKEARAKAARIRVPDRSERRPLRRRREGRKSD